MRTEPEMTEQHGPVEIGSLSIERVDASPVPEFALTEIDRQIATARAYPRDLQLYKRNAIAMVEDLAHECFYQLERKDHRSGTRSAIPGPSIRLAEIIAHTYGNLRSDSGVTSEDPRYITVWGAAWDLETNVAHRVQIRRPIVGRSGKRYSDDMVGVTTNAAMAIARRNAIFAVVPKPLWNALYLLAMEIATDPIEPATKQRMQKAVDWFGTQGIDAPKLYDWLGLKAGQDPTPDHIQKLLGVAQAIRQGETTITEVFGS
jgi:hypothetical protein